MVQKFVVALLNTYGRFQQKQVFKNMSFEVNFWTSSCELVLELLVLSRILVCMFTCMVSWFQVFRSRIYLIIKPGHSKVLFRFSEMN